jgi:hypothetical protein
MSCSGPSRGQSVRPGAFPDVQRPGPARKSFSKTWSRSRIRCRGVPPARTPRPAAGRGPIRGRMLGDIEMHRPAPAVAQHHEHEQDPKGRRGHREEIQRDQILGAILQKCAPRLRRRPPRSEHVLRNRRLRDGQAQLQRLAMDPRRAPERIGAAHLPNQVLELRFDRGPTTSASTLPRPVAPGPLPVPFHHGPRPLHL